MKVHTLILALALAILCPTISNAEEVIATLNPTNSNTTHATEFRVHKPALELARRLKKVPAKPCKTFGERCGPTVDDCCLEYVCLNPGPTCQ